LPLIKNIKRTETRVYLSIRYCYYFFAIGKKRAKFSKRKILL